jgi:TetR/AcrR family transcriptional regulator
MTRKRQAKRIALMRAAVGAFNRRGFHQTSLEEIGDALGITKAALYYYFPNKSALLAACFDMAQDIARESLATARREAATGRERLALFFRLYIERTNEELSDCILLTEDYALEPAHRDELIRRRDAMERSLRKLVKEGIADGSIVPCDPKLAVFMLLGAVNWMPKWFSPAGKWSYAQVAVATSDMLDRMLSTSPRPALSQSVSAIAAAASPAAE